MATAPQRHVRIGIIGGGPAGLTAGIYASRANLKTCVFIGIEHTSQMFTTTDVENFPSHVAIKGPALMENIQNQAEHCGAELLYEDVHSIDVSSRPFKIIHGYENEITLADALIIATGSTARRLDCKGEKEYWQKGVSACAVCDSSMANGKAVIVVGGGDVACEEATYLTKIATKVYMVLRRDKFRASGAMVKKVMNEKKIEIIYDSAVEEIKGDGKSVTAVTIKHLKDGKMKDLDVGALYWAVGHDPQTSFLKKGQIEQDEAGYILLKEHPTQKTSVEGVFAAGDCCDHIYRQAVVAAGSGSKAALDAERWLAMQE